MSPARPIRDFARAFATTAILTGSALAADHHVDALFGDDSTGNGTAAAPWRTITRAHQAAPVAGDRILVAPGVYDVALGEQFPIALRARVAVIGAGADRTFVRGTGPQTPLLFSPGGGQTWYRLTDATLADAAIGVRQNAPGDTFLVLERVLVENTGTGVLVTDGPGIYSQCALLNCFLRDNGVGFWVDEAWSGFGGSFGWAYGCTLIDNGTGLYGTTTFGNLPSLVVQHSIVRKNFDDGFVGDFNFLAPTIGCLTSEPSLIGQNGNVFVAPALLNYYGFDPHLRNDSGARNLLPAGVAHWPPAPAPGVPSPSWWNLSFDPTFESVPDIDGRARIDGMTDAGCDEAEAPFAYVWGEPALGAAVDLAVLNWTTAPVALYVSLGGSASVPTPYGVWQLEVPFVGLGTLPVDASGHLVVSATLPAVAGLVGIDLYVQGHSAAPPIAITPLEWLRLLP